jgi:hypothetical protein
MISRGSKRCSPADMVLKIFGKTRATDHAK